MGYFEGEYVFGDWKIVRRIGNGASGQVYQIIKDDQNAQLEAALKVMHIPGDPSLIETLASDGMSDDEIRLYLKNMADDVVKEIKIMISMKGAPHIVSCEDYKLIEEENGMRWIVLIRMELLTPLNRYMETNSMTEADVYRLASHLTGSLSLFEERGIIHRDIKPENIFVNDFMEFKLGDFGIARVCDGTRKALSTKGTENYMAPEVYRTEHYDHTADIYSLGLVLYKLLNNNRLPFYPTEGTYTPIQSQQARAERLSGKKKIPMPVNASERFGEVILKMCAYSPEDRYESADDLMRDLASFAPADTQVSQAQDGHENPAVTAGTGELEAHNHTSCVFAAAGSGTHLSGRQTEAGPSGTEEAQAEHVKRVRPGAERAEAEKTAAEKTAAEKKGAEKKAAEQTPAGKTPAESAGDSRDGQASENRTSHTDTRPKSGRPSSVRERADEEEKKRQKQGGRKKLLMIFAVLAVILTIGYSYLRSLKYDLTVDGGSGGGEYKAGTMVSLKAESEAGKAFAGWQLEGVTLTEDQLSQETLSFKMPRRSVRAQAEYETLQFDAVINQGSGSGQYELGDEVEIEADAPEAGYQFREWSVISGSPSVSNKNSAKTSFSMPENNVELTAVYEALTYYLKVNGVKGTGDYEFGERVTLTASEENGAAFTGWKIEGDVLPEVDENALTETELEFTMPAGDLEITAVYETNEHTLTVTGGSGSGTYKYGETVEITADEPEEGYRFKQWKALKGRPTFEDSTLQTTYFTMPDQDVEIEAETEAIDYTVTVTNGSGGGTYHVGDSVTISASSAKDNMAFSKWSVDSGTMTLTDPSALNITFRMPAEDLAFSAHYAAAKYTVKVTGGTGSGMYTAGDEVTIRANAKDSAGNTFYEWQIVSGNLDTSELDLTNPELIFPMPESNLKIQAAYLAASSVSSYALTVNGGSGSGYYEEGQKVTITHDAPKSGMKFLYWFAADYAGSEDLSQDSLTITMPANNVVFTAIFVEE